jgi:hypothetical protein
MVELEPRQLPGENPDAATDAILVRLRYALTRAFDYGSGLFVLGVIGATVTALSVRVALPEWKLYNAAYATAIRTLFHTRLESEPTGNQQVILGVVPASIEAAVESQSRPSALKTALLKCAGTRACPAGAVQEAIQATFGKADALTERTWRMCASGRSPGRAKNKSIRKCIAAASAKGLSPEDFGPLHKQVTKELIAVVKARLDPGNAAQAADGMLTPCADYHPATWNARSTTLPAPECDVNETFSNTTLLIPQQLVPEERVSPRPWTPRVALGIIESRLFSQVARHIKRAFAPCQKRCPQPANSHPPGDWPSPRPVAAYFISVDGLLRYWTPETAPASPSLAQGNPVRDWTQSPYFYPLLTSDEPWSHTGLYIDIAGHGLIRTYCYPVQGERIVDVRDGSEGQPNYGFTYDHHDSTVTLPPIRPTFIGAVCVDLGFPQGREVDKGVLEALQRNPLIDAALYDISKGGSGHVISVVKEEGGGATGGWSNSELIRTIESDACRAGDGESGGLIATNEVSTCKLSDDTEVDLVPLYRTPSGRLVTLAISPHSPALPKPLKIFMLLAILGAGFMAVSLLKLGSSQRESELVGQMSRLRNLPVGLIECDSKDRLTAGNDRLEEMVMRKVRKFGVEGQVMDLKFDELFGNFMQGVKGEGATKMVVPDITEDDAKIEEVKLDSNLWAVRLAGRRSVYFATVRGEGRSPLKWGDESKPTDRTSWVKIIATPVIGAGDIETILAAAEGRTLRWVPTFGVIMGASAKEAELLQKALNEIRTRNSDPGRKS